MNWTALVALVLGIVIGALFAAFDLDVPAPRSLAGVAGIAGITLGFFLVSKVTA